MPLSVSPAKLTFVTAGMAASAGQGHLCAHPMKKGTGMSRAGAERGLWERKLLSGSGKLEGFLQCPGLPHQAALGLL